MLVMTGLQGRPARAEGHRAKAVALEFSGYHKLRNVCMEGRQERSTRGFPLERGEGAFLALLTWTMASSGLLETEVSRNPR